MGMGPESITLHTFCKKRAAEVDMSDVSASGMDACGLQDRARETLGGAGYLPYYVYKQKNAVSGAENVGYAKAGFECAYNVAMMGDSAGIIGVGAGAAGKAVKSDGKTDGYHNTKDINHYCRDAEAIASRNTKMIERILG
jgi:oxygen-independent coproporphyrinogen-3 oxidase